MVLKHETVENNHYYYVMAWRDNDFKNAPIRKKKFDIYDDALDYYEKAILDLCPECFVQLFEMIDGKRKLMKSTEEDDS